MPPRAASRVVASSSGVSVADSDTRPPSASDRPSSPPSSAGKRKRSKGALVVITKENSARTQLVTICKALRLPTGGTWEELRARILAKVAKERPSDVNRLACLKEILVEELSKRPAIPRLPPPKLTQDLVSQHTAASQATPAVAQDDAPPVPFTDLLQMSTTRQLTQEDLIRAIGELQSRAVSTETVTKQLVTAVNDNTASIAGFAKTLYPAVADSFAVRKQVETLAEQYNEMCKDQDETALRYTANFTTLENDVARVEDTCSSLRDSHRVEMQEAKEKLDQVDDLSKRTAKTAEINSRSLRACNVLVLGWPAVVSPLADARAWLERIDCKVDLVSAKRLPPVIRNGVNYPGRLCVVTAHPSIAIRVLAASRKHANGSRTMTYFAKPDLTFEQSAAKRQADDRIKELKQLHPDHDYRERNGKVARFDYNDDGVVAFHSWVTSPDTPPPVRRGFPPPPLPRTQSQIDEAVIFGGEGEADMDLST